MTVEDWGIGKPDFVEITSPTRTEVQADSQTSWSLTFAGVLPPNSITEATLYTVPTSNILIFGHSKSSSAIDGIGYAYWLIDGVPRFPVYLGSPAVVESFSDMAGVEYAAGTVLGLHMENTLSCAQSVAGGFSGFLYKM